MRFFRFLFFLLLLITLAQFAPRLIGESRSSSTLTAVMTKPDGTICEQLCLFGIIPTQTSVEQAIAILHAHPLTHDAAWLDDHTLKLSGPEAYIAFSQTSDSLIDTIVLADNLHDSGVAIPASLIDSVMLGDVIDAFGIPEVGLPGSEYFVVNYPDVGVVAASARPNSFTIRFLPHTGLSILMLQAPRPCSKREGSFQFLIHPWMGFTSFKRYFYDRPQRGATYRSSGVPVPPYATCQ